MWSTRGTAWFLELECLSGSRCRKLEIVESPHQVHLRTRRCTDVRQDVTRLGCQEALFMSCQEKKVRARSARYDPYPSRLTSSLTSRLKSRLKVTSQARSWLRDAERPSHRAPRTLRLTLNSTHASLIRSRSLGCSVRSSLHIFWLHMTASASCGQLLPAGAVRCSLRSFEPLHGVVGRSHMGHRTARTGPPQKHA